MTGKQIDILNAGLKLFASEGFHAVSTKRIAAEANVSEALIFRHFENKEGLLGAIMELASDAFSKLFKDILEASSPGDLIKKTIELPFRVPASEHNLWRLINSLKWQSGKTSEDLFLPIKSSLEKAFSELGYEDPIVETQILLMFVDGAATSILLHDPKNQKEIMQTMFAKYFN